jgi:hypothetical protein
MRREGSEYFQAQVDAKCVNLHVDDPPVRSAITILPYPGKDQAADHLIGRLHGKLDRQYRISKH